MQIYLKKHVYLQIVKKLYQKVDMPVCVSSKLRTELKTLMGLDFEVLPLPLKLHLFSNYPLDKRNPVFVHIGTRPGKNVEVSIRSIRTLVKEHHLDAKLIVLGWRNDYFENLLHKYRNMVPENLEWAFNLPNSTVRGLLSRAMALILPSKYEALSYVVLEAFASGLPAVVSSAIPSEMVQDGYNGFRLSSFDPNLYAEKLAILLKRDDIWREMSKNCLKSAKGFSHKKVAERYQNAIESIARK